MSNLSFKPQFHSEIEHDGKKCWTISPMPFGNPLQFFKEINEESKRIKEEGGVIFFFDPKFDAESKFNF